MTIAIALTSLTLQVAGITVMINGAANAVLDLGMMINDDLKKARMND